jgi:hypothetical protein
VEPNNKKAKGSIKSSELYVLTLFQESGLSMDLVHFVKDLPELEEEKKRAKDPNFKKKMTSQSLKPKAETESKPLTKHVYLNILNRF